MTDSGMILKKAEAKAAGSEAKIQTYVLAAGNEEEFGCCESTYVVVMFPRLPLRLLAAARAKILTPLIL
jgi:hypothetical protein